MSATGLLGKHWRVLIVGAGSIGQRHLRTFRATERATVGICEASSAVCKKVAEQYQVAEAFDDVDRALAAGWDAAVVCTPADTHIPLARRAAEAGLHLFIEKPLSTSTEGVAELAELVRRQGLKAAVAYVYRVHPLLTAMRTMVISGELGRPVEVVVVSGHDFAAARPDYRDIYFARRETGGGAIQDALTHLVNAMEWLVGPVTRVSADCARQRLEGITAEDTAHLIARHGDILASYSLNQYQPATEITLTVVCERGMLRCDLHENRWRWVKTGGTWQDFAMYALDRDVWFTAQATQFLDVLDGQAEPLCSLADGWQTLRVNLAALHSADHGSIPIDVSNFEQDHA